jgi:CIC family chloride channel protein
VVEHSILGEHPVLDVPGAYGLTHPSSLVAFVMVGLAAGIAGQAFTRSLLWVRAAFRKRRARWLHPAIGGLGTGSIAAVVLEVFSTVGVAGAGYETLTGALRGELSLQVMAVLFVAKFAATILSYSSGGAGGIFAPSLFIGAMLGGLFMAVDQRVLGHADASVGAFAIVGMGAFFAAVIRAPITSILIIFEMTGNYRLVLPLMVANAIAYVTARRFQSVPIYDALLEQDGLHTPQSRRSSRMLAGLRVSEAMVREVVSLEASSTLSESLERIEKLAFASFPIAGEGGVLRGVLTEARIRRLVADGAGGDRVDAHARLREYLRAGEPLRDALSTMNRLGVRQMAVVDDVEHKHLVGIIAMSDIVRVLLRAEDRIDEGAPASHGGV